jgi:hypothetical protein
MKRWSHLLNSSLCKKIQHPFRLPSRTEECISWLCTDNRSQHEWGKWTLTNSWMVESHFVLAIKLSSCRRWYFASIDNRPELPSLLLFASMGVDMVCCGEAMCVLKCAWLVRLPAFPTFVGVSERQWGRPPHPQIELSKIPRWESGLQRHRRTSAIVHFGTILNIGPVVSTSKKSSALFL